MDSDLWLVDRIGPLGCLARVEARVVVVEDEDALEVEAGLVVGDQLDEEGVVGRAGVEPE